MTHPDHGWVIPLTLRPGRLLHHGGQVCFPGGRIESGESPLQAACREFTEELGIEPLVRNLCGQLPDHYVFASDNWVHPVVAVIDRPEGSWRPDPAEVAKVILLPVGVLMDFAFQVQLTRRQPVVGVQGQSLGHVRFRTRAFQCPDIAGLVFDDAGREIAGPPPPIWGATAMMLGQLAQLLR